jgi:hypothetical protein
VVTGEGLGNVVDRDVPQLDSIGAGALVGCLQSDAIQPPADDWLRAGTWGGENAGMIVDDLVVTIPEPGVMGCLLAGGSVLLRKRRTKFCKTPA